MQMLISEMMGRVIPLRCLIDNTQAIVATGHGYSKKLRHLTRTHRVSIGVLHDLVRDKELQVTVLFVSTDHQKAGIFTKALTPAALFRARMMIGVRQIAGGDIEK